MAFEMKEGPIMSDEKQPTAPFVCPSCGGGFPAPTKVTKQKYALLKGNYTVRGYACPWCEHMLKAESKTGKSAKMEDVKARVAQTPDEDPR